ncbi:MAG: hypothetical protein J07HQX50_00387 [Haloquadratum sp. J07HQX50]|jgi:hypothetical protein|nr:MAG: hypothetical protein J07HQX50_00387 [Haloquadratum sp. J07HQX50]
MIGWTESLIAEWETVPITDGYRGLVTLVEREFNGVITNGNAGIFLLSGNIIGIIDAELEDFESVSLTAARSPDRGLPLLAVMKEADVDPTAQYYTNEQPLAEAIDTLEESGFTGYVELSENVLSGDYYTIFHGGKSTHVAFVGAGGRLITGEDAYEQAIDEVGIYAVHQTPVDIIELPESVTAVKSSNDDDLTEREDDDRPAKQNSAVSHQRSTNTSDRGDDNDADAEAQRNGNDTLKGQASPETNLSTPAKTADGDSQEETEQIDPNPETEAEEWQENPDAWQNPSQLGNSGTEDTTQTADSDIEANEIERIQSSNDESLENGEIDAGEDKTASSPAIDETDMTPVGESPEAAEQRPTDARAQDTDPFLSSEESTQQTVPQASQSQENEPTGPMKRTSTSTAPPEDSIPEAENDAIDSSGSSEEIDPLAVERLRGRLSAFEERLLVMTEQRDELRRRCDTLSNTNQTLRDRIDSLEAKREELSRENHELQTELSAIKEVSSNRESLSPMKALSQTSLFIGYDNQKATTLGNIKQDSASVEELRENISIEYHTEFDTDEVEIEGELYEPFLHGTAAFGFVKWLVTDVPFQIIETNHVAELGGIFNKLDDIDRVGCREMVQVESVDSSFEGTFDLVLRNTVGEPLFVADIHSSRQPTAAPRVQTMVEKATQVGNINTTLSGAFLITQSFFEPAALRAATEATTNGLFSWSGRRSYRKLTRKNGFHLSLVERRNGSFHFDLPDI